MGHTNDAETTILFDADDFCEDNNSLDLLFRIRSKVPGFKASLFTIPGLCSKEFIEEIKRIEWIRMYPHGWLHTTPRECQAWSYQESKDYLEKIEPLRLGKCFKAPGWQISDGMYQALLEKDYMVADQEYNNSRRPDKLKSYILDSPNKVHGHIGNMGGENANSLDKIFDTVVQLRGNFEFIL